MRNALFCGDYPEGRQKRRESEDLEYRDLKKR